MSDVVVSTTKSVTSVSTTDNVTEISITETPVEVSSSTAGLQGPPGANSDPTYVFVTNKTGAQLNKGSIVYVSGANGTHTQVSLALATGDVTSARTLGWLAEDIANNATGLCMVEGYLDGVNTQGVTEGAQLYLSPTTPGAFTETKPSAPDHMVYVGFCSKASAGNGRVFVFVQNGAELEELHDVKIVSPQNNDLLRYVAGTALWENVASTAVTVGSAISAGTSSYAVSAGTSVYANSAATAITSGTASYSVLSGTAVTISGSITKSQVSDFTSGTVTSASTAQQAGTAVYSVSAGTSDYSVLSGTAVGLSGSIVRSQVSDFSSGTVASAGTAQQAGTAVFAASAGTSITSGTADYSVLSGTAVTISGSITNSQVSDFASGTVANISGTVTQAQVANLTTDLAGKANLVGGNTFTDAQVITVSGTASIPLVVRGTAGQSANLTEWTNPAGSTVIARVDKNGAVSANYFGPSATGLLGYLDWTTNSPIFNTGGTGVVGLVVKGVANQSANLFSVQSNSSELAFISAAGNLNVFQQVRVGGSSGLGQLSVTSINAANIGAVIRGASGQTANLQEWQSNTGGTAALITSAGRGAFPRISAGAATDLGYGTLSLLANSTATVAIVARGLAGQSANLQEWQESNAGTPTAINAFGQMRVRTFNASLSDIALATFAGYATEKPLVVRGAASQSANLQEWQNSAGTPLTVIGSEGFIKVGNTATGGQVAITATAAGNRPLVLKGAASQTANLQEWQDSSGGTVAYIAPTGFLNINNASLRVNTAGASFNARINVATDGTAVIGQVIRGAPSQSANLQEWQVDGGTVRAFVNNLGRVGIRTSSLLIGSESLAVAAVNPTDQGIVVRGAASQSANLQEWQLSSGSTALAVNSAGLINATRAVTVTQTNTGEFYLRLAGVASQTGDFLQVNDPSANPLFRIASTGAVTAGGTARLGQVTVIPASTATVGVVVQGLLNQSADLQQWQTSTGSTAAYLGSGGAFRAAVLQTSSAAVDARLRNAGGEITFAKATAVSTNPGAGYGKIYFRDGTNAGTLKLVVIAGTAGAETTILDNIPT